MDYTMVDKSPACSTIFALNQTRISGTKHPCKSPADVPASDFANKFPASEALRMQKYADSLLEVNSVCRNKRGQPCSANVRGGSFCIIFPSWSTPSRNYGSRLCRLLLTGRRWPLNVNPVFIQSRNYPLRDFVRTIRPSL